MSQSNSTRDEEHKETLRRERAQRQNQVYSSKQVIRGDFNEPFRYKAPKQPSRSSIARDSSESSSTPSATSTSKRSTSTADGEASSTQSLSSRLTDTDNFDADMPSGTSTKRKMICNAHVHLFNFTNAKNIRQIGGIHGVAIVCENNGQSNSSNNQSSNYSLIVYDPFKRQQRIKVPIDDRFSLTLLPSGTVAIPSSSADGEPSNSTHVALFMDASNAWVLGFSSAEPLIDFSRHIALTKDAFISSDVDMDIDSPRTMITQELSLGPAEYPSACAGDKVKIRYSIYSTSLHHPQGLGPVLVTSPSKKLVLGDDKLDRRIESSLVGMKKKGVRFVVIPPLSTSEAISWGNYIPANTTICLELQLLQHKVATDTSSYRSSAYEEEEEEEELSISKAGRAARKTLTASTRSDSTKSTKSQGYDDDEFFGTKKKTSKSGSTTKTTSSASQSRRSRQSIPETEESEDHSEEESEYEVEHDDVSDESEPEEVPQKSKRPTRTQTTKKPAVVPSEVEDESEHEASPATDGDDHQTEDDEDEDMFGAADDSVDELLSAVAKTGPHQSSHADETLDESGSISMVEKTDQSRDTHFDSAVVDVAPKEDLKDRMKRLSQAANSYAATPLQPAVAPVILPPVISESPQPQSSHVEMEKPSIERSSTPIQPIHSTQPDASNFHFTQQNKTAPPMTPQQFDQSVDRSYYASPVAPAPADFHQSRNGFAGSNLAQPNGYEQSPQPHYQNQSTQSYHSQHQNNHYLQQQQQLQQQQPQQQQQYPPQQPQQSSYQNGYYQEHSQMQPMHSYHDQYNQHQHQHQHHQHQLQHQHQHQHQRGHNQYNSPTHLQPTLSNQSNSNYTLESFLEQYDVITPGMGSESRALLGRLRSEGVFSVSDLLLFEDGDWISLVPQIILRKKMINAVKDYKSKVDGQKQTTTPRNSLLMSDTNANISSFQQESQNQIRNQKPGAMYTKEDLLAEYERGRSDCLMTAKAKIDSMKATANERFASLTSELEDAQELVSSTKAELGIAHEQLNAIKALANRKSTEFLAQLAEEELAKKDLQARLRELEKEQANLTGQIQAEKQKRIEETTRIVKGLFDDCYEGLTQKLFPHDIVDGTQAYKIVRSAMKTSIQQLDEYLEGQK